MLIDLIIIYRAKLGQVHCFRVCTPQNVSYRKFSVRPQVYNSFVSYLHSSLSCYAIYKSYTTRKVVELVLLCIGIDDNFIIREIANAACSIYVNIYTSNVEK